MKTFNGIDELREAIGTHLGHSPWHTVSQEQIDLFAEATGDHQWIHVDAAQAAQGHFGSAIAHGYLTLSLIPKLMWEVYTVEGLRMGVNYGSDKVRFPAPVPVDSQIRVGVELLSLTPGAGGERLTSQLTVEVKGGEKPAYILKALSILVPDRPARAPGGAGRATMRHGR